MKHLFIFVLLFLMPALSLSQEGGEALLKAEEDIKVEVDSARLEEVGKALKACFKEAKANEELRHKELIRQCFKDHISTAFAPVCEESKTLVNYQGSDLEKKIKEWKDKESDVVFNTANELARIRQEIAGNRNYWVIPRGQWQGRNANAVLTVLPWAFGGALFVGKIGFWGGGVYGIFKGATRVNKVTGKKEPIPGLGGVIVGGIGGAMGGALAGGAIGGVGGLGFSAVMAGGAAGLGYLDRHKERRAYLVDIAKTEDFCNVPKEEFISQDLATIQDLRDDNLLEAFKNQDQAKIKEYGSPWFLRAASSANYNIMDTLLDIGVDINAQDEDGYTALDLAIINGRSRVAEYLISKDPKRVVNRKNRFEETPLHEAASRRNLRIASALVDNGADIDAKDHRGSTPFKKLFPVSFDYGGRDMAEFLLQNGADVNAKDDVERTALFSSVRWEELDQIQFLLQNGADPNIKDGWGTTALMWAASEGKKEAVAALLRSDRTDKSLKSKYGEKTALDYAKEQGHTEIVRLLEGQGT